jgi:exopolysaccharide production protein ExoZ
MAGRIRVGNETRHGENVDGSAIGTTVPMTEGPRKEGQVVDSELYGIQILRAVAAIAVVLHHALEQSNGASGRFSPDWLTTAGAAGVDIFFVISGFIMLHVSFLPRRPVPSAGTFLFRRATRIYPLYWLCCIAILLISAAGFLSSHRYSVSKIISSMLLLPGETIIGVSWTLVYEMYFYFVFASTLWLRSLFATMLTTTVVIIMVLSTASMMQKNHMPEFFSTLYR